MGFTRYAGHPAEGSPLPVRGSGDRGLGTSEGESRYPIAVLRDTRDRLPSCFSNGDFSGRYQREL